MSQMPLLGADTDALRALRQQMDAFSDQLRRVGATTTVQLEALSWFGADRTAFHDQWTGSYHPNLLRIAGAVTEAGTAIEGQAADQDRASSGSGAGGAAVGAGAAGAGAGAAGAGAAGAGAAGAAGAAGTGQGQTGDPELGSLSRQYESNGNPGTVSTGRGDHGGVSYGTYQLSTNMGTAQEFMTWARANHPDVAEALGTSRPGSAEFSANWRALAARDPEGFGAVQHDFIQASHYEPRVREVEAAVPGINLAGRDPVVRDVLWSTAVQQRGFTDNIFSNAVGNRDVTQMSDEELIRAVYAERGRGGGRAYFTSSPELWPGIMRRYRNEQADALARLGQ